MPTVRDICALFALALFYIAISDANVVGMLLHFSGH
jgi:hypothetical protein